MFKVIRHMAIAAIAAFPLVFLLGNVPSDIREYLPVYSTPQSVQYTHDEKGFQVKFRILKNHEFVIPTKKDDQDTYVVLTYTDTNGELVSQPSDITPADKPGRPLRNILVVGTPTTIGPYIVEVPEKMRGRLESMTIMIKGDRPLFGEVYEPMGPFNLKPLNEVITTDASTGAVINIGP